MALNANPDNSRYKVIPLSAIPDQKFSVTLGGQICQIRLYWRYGWLFADIDVGTDIVCRGAICMSSQWLIQQPKVNFSGNLMFVDTDGHNSQIELEKIGTRYKLVYVLESEIA